MVKCIRNSVFYCPGVTKPGTTGPSNMTHYTVLTCKQKHKSIILFQMYFYFLDFFLYYTNESIQHYVNVCFSHVSLYAKVLIFDKDWSKLTNPKQEYLKISQVGIASKSLFN